MHPILKVSSDQGCQTYLLGCPETKDAVLVDPKVGRRQVLGELLHQYGLTVKSIVDTHTHADHLSDSVFWCGQGATLFMSQHTTCERPHEDLVHGATFRVGNLSFQVIDVPGHTPDSVALYGHGMALTGDSLFVGSLARADFRGSNPTRLFESVQERLMTLPDDTLIFPGHSYNDLLFSTVAKERCSNQALSFPNSAAYAEHLQAVEGRGNTPDVDLTLEKNLEADPQLPEDPGVVAACCSGGGTVSQARAKELWPEELEPQLESFTAKETWIDVRDPWEFAAGHVPGGINIPLGELGFHLDRLKDRDGAVFQCKGGVRSMTAARTLVHLGILKDPISMAGGFDRWLADGLPVD